MDRRNFLAAAGVAAAMGAAGAAQAQGDKEPNQYFEFRKYITIPGKKGLEDYLANAAIPAWNRAGIENVGAFTVKFGLNSPPAIYVLLPHPSLESVVSAPAKLMDDAEYVKAAEAFLNAPASDPMFFRIESSLMRAFDGMPQLAVPPQAKEKKPHLLQLRIYESHTPAHGKKKVKMFNSGEIEIFKKAGTNPVFFGETIIGPRMPNLHYMLSFDDMAAKDAGWKAFGSSPEWKELRTRPEFTPDPVSNISDIILQPAKYSQL